MNKNMNKNTVVESANNIAVDNAKAYASKKQNKGITKKQKEKMYKMIIDRATEKAKLESRPWTVIDLPIDFLEIPKCQVPLDMTQVRKIIKEFDIKRVDIKLVNYRDGKFNLLDGQHTAKVLKELGYNTMTVKLFVGLTEKEECYLFLNQHHLVKKKSIEQQYQSGVRCEVEPYFSIEQILKERGLHVGKDKSPKAISSARKVLQIYRKFGKDGLEYTLDLIEEAGWGNDPKALTEAGLNIGFHSWEAIKNNPEKYDALLALLQQFDTSTEFVTSVHAQYNVTVTKHPENLVGMAIEDFLR